MAYDHLIGAGFDRWTSGEYTPGQEEFSTDYTSPAILYSGAYRAGKTEICSRAVIRHALTYSRARVGVFRAKLKSLRNSTLVTLLELVDPSWVADWNNSELVLRLFNGSTISFLGCDFADRIGSIELSAAFIDEAHEVSEEAYGMIVGRMSAPLVIDLAEGVDTANYAEGAVHSRQLWLACNPKAQSHWLYQDFINPDTRRPGRTFYSSNTLVNRNLPAAYVEQNLAQYARPGVTVDRLLHAVKRVRSGEDPADGSTLAPLLTSFGQRNLLGMWVALEGAVFDLDEREHVLTELPREWGQAVKTYAAVDFGYHHPRLIVATKHESDQLLVRDYWHGSEEVPSAIVEAVASADKDWHFDKVFMPPDQPGLLKQARELMGSGKVITAKNKVVPGIGSVQTALSLGVLRFLRQDSGSFNLFWSEMTGYQWKQDKDGRWLDEPLKEADHFPDALRYLVFSLSQLGKLSLDKPKAPELLADQVQGLEGWLAGI